MPIKPHAALAADMERQPPNVRASSFVNDVLDSLKNREEAVDRMRQKFQNITTGEGEAAKVYDAAFAAIEAHLRRQAINFDTGEINDAPLEDRVAMALVELTQAKERVAEIRASAKQAVRPARPVTSL